MPEGTQHIARTPRQNGHLSAALLTARQLPDYLAPLSIAGVRELADMMATAEWAPSSFRDIAGKYVVEKIALAIMHGATIGLGPFAAVQSIAVIDGRPAIWG